MGRTGQAKGDEIDLTEFAEVDLTEVLQALANPLTCRFVELVAMAPRLGIDLQDHFDLGLTHLHRAAAILMKAGLLSQRNDTHRERLYCFDDRGLLAVRAWLDRVLAIRTDFGNESSRSS
jgi:hypothetical protein